MNARASFLIVFVVAAGGAWLLSGVDSRWFSVAWAVVAMLGYLAWVKVKLPDYGESQGFADDFYFLGFLLTLVALATVLMRIGALGEEDLLRAVLSQFGLALGTTIIGLAGRTWLLLDKEDTDETEERARKKVERAFDELSHSLTRLSTQADVFASQYIGKLEASMAPLEKAVAGVATAIGAIGDELGKARTGVVELSTSLRTSSDGLDEAGAAIQTKLDSGGIRVLDALDQLAKGIDDSGRLVRGQLNTATGAIDQANQRSAAGIEQALSRMDQVVASTNASSQNLSKVSEEIATVIAQDLRLVAQGVRALAESTGNAVRGFGSGGDGLAETAAAWRVQLEELTRVQGELTGQAAASGRAVAEVRTDIADGVNELVRALRALDGR